MYEEDLESKCEWEQDFFSFFFGPSQYIISLNLEVEVVHELRHLRIRENKDIGKVEVESKVIQGKRTGGRVKPHLNGKNFSTVQEATKTSSCNLWMRVPNCPRSSWIKTNESRY